MPNIPKGAAGRKKKSGLERYEVAITEERRK